MHSVKPHRRDLLVSFLLALVAYGLAIAACQSVVASDLELWTYDFLVNHGGYYSNNNDSVVIVAFDDPTVTRLGRFPIPRTVLADVIRRVSQAKPRIIGLDFFLTEPRGPEEDNALQTALTQAGNVILASQLGSGGLPDLEPLPAFCQIDPSGAPGFCKDGTPGALGFAFVNMPVDNDGFMRSMLLLPPGPGRPLSFPLTLAQQYSGKPIRPAGRNAALFLGRRIQYLDVNRKTALIAWNPAPAKMISALSVLEDDKLDLAKTFSDKLVLIGQSSDAARDRFFTPVFRPRSRDGSRNLLPGSAVHAAAIHTLLQGPAVSVLSPKVNLAIAFSLVWLVSWFTLRTRLTYGIATVIIAMFVLYAAAQGLMAFEHSWMKVVGTELALLLVPPAGLSYRFVQERFSRSLADADRKQIMGIFSRYVSPEIAEQIWQRKQEIILAGQERTATILFSDIRGFTALSAGKPSQEVLRWLNRYFTAMDEVISQEGGFLNKFIGDGLMVIFGVPLSRGVEQDAYHAVRCAMQMLKRVEELNREVSFGHDPEIRIGIGIHTGPLTCGSVGSEKRLEYTVIGESVNLASRLESLTKELDAPIVMSETTEQLIREHFPAVRDLGETKVRGFENEIHVYTIETLDQNAAIA